MSIASRIYEASKAEILFVKEKFSKVKIDGISETNILNFLNVYMKSLDSNWLILDSRIDLYSPLDISAIQKFGTSNLDLEISLM